MTTETRAFFSLAARDDYASMLAGMDLVVVKTTNPADGVYLVTHNTRPLPHL